VRLAALDLAVDLRCGSGWSQARIEDFRESQVFHLNSRVLTFTLMLHCCAIPLNS